jgi:hypothetical protein
VGELVPGVQKARKIGLRDPPLVKDALGRLGAEKADETSVGWVRVRALDI